MIHIDTMVQWNHTLYAMHYRSMEPCMDPRLYLQLYNFFNGSVVDSYRLYDSMLYRTIVPNHYGFMILRRY